MRNESMMRQIIEYLQKNYEKVAILFFQHLQISLIALSIVLVISIPLGVYITRKEKLAPIVIGIANVFQTVPSLALLCFLIAIFGTGNDNAIAALVLYGILPILQNTYTGIKNVPSQVVEAARGMGMTDLQILTKVEMPLAMPMIISGVRVSTVWIIGTATLASYIGGGGLGRLVTSGLSSLRYDVVFIGASLATLMALTADFGLKRLHDYLMPETRAVRIEKKAQVKLEKVLN